MASTAPMTGATSTADRRDAYDDGGGWLLFSAIMISLVGVLNVIYGIAAVDDARFFIADQKYIISELSTWGWVMLILGALQMAAAVSIIAGGSYGRWFGIATASLNAIAALLSIPAYPFWSLAIFAVDVLIIYGLAAHGGRGRVAY